MCDLMPNINNGANLRLAYLDKQNTVIQLQGASPPGPHQGLCHLGPRWGLCPQTSRYRLALRITLAMGSRPCAVVSCADL